MDVNLSVDGQVVDLMDTIRLHQREAYPGGHRYLLTVTGEALKVFERFHISESTTSAALDQAAVFFGIECIAARTVGERQGRARFILNTVDQVIRDGDQVTVLGACSVPIE